MAYNKNGNYTQDQITNLLFSYMVEGQSGAYVCKYILGMSEKEIGNTAHAWRKIQRYYKAYGFVKRYNNGSAFRNISKYKLQNYVSIYWNKNATEKDLVAFFPEIFDDLNEAKRIEGERELLRENSWDSGSNSTRNTGFFSQNFEKRKPRNYASNNVTQNTSYFETTNNNNTSKKFGLKRNYKTATSSNQTHTVNRGSRSGYGRNSSNSVSVLGIVFLIIFIISIVNSGIASTLFYKVTRGFSFIFWILELLLFYGGIVLFIISLIKKTTRNVWKGCVGLSALGLCFGCISTGDFLTGIILGVIGLAFMLANRNGS